MGNVTAARLGVITACCSCSAVPGFIGFVAAGIPLGVTMSFLIASPMVDGVALALLYGLFGWQVAAVYVAAGPHPRRGRRTRTFLPSRSGRRGLRQIGDGPAERGSRPYSALFANQATFISRSC